MKYTEQGVGSVDLGQDEFVYPGGEANVFKKGKTIYKIFHNPSKIIPFSKIQELSVLNKTNIIKPKNVILDGKNKTVGFTMDLVDGVPFSRLFTNGFRKDNNVNHKSIIKLVENMIETISFIHSKKCLIVDLNEMNFLSDKSFEIPYFIDVTSYQTPSFPPTALNFSVKDWNSNKFSELTDWFSFGIVSCQLFIGIHPYKGNHPNYKQNQLEDRMKDNISIFHKGVSLNSAVRDFSYIPSDIKDWYIKLFEKGERIPPPRLLGPLNIQVKKSIIKTTNNFEFNLISSYKENILKVKFYNGIRIVNVENKIWINKTDYNFSSNKVDVIFLLKTLDPIFVKIENKKLILFNSVKKETIDTNIECSEKMIINNSIYVRSGLGNKLIELLITDCNGKIVPSIKHTWNILPNSSNFLSNCIYQNVLGKPYLVIPKPTSTKNSSCQISYIPELNGYKIIDGKYENGVCMIIGSKNNIYDKLILRFTESGSYDCRIISDVDLNSINFTVLDNGICVSIDSDELLEVFSKDTKNNNINKIKDPKILLSMVLSKDGTKVVFYKDKELYSMTMKGK